MKDGRILAVTSGKGGVGKTTVSAGLAKALSARGRKVLAIDGDLDFRNLDMIIGLSGGFVYDLDDVIADRCPLPKAIYHVEDGLFYMAATVSPENSHKIDPLSAAALLNHLRGFFDDIIIDTAAGCGRSFELFTKNADTALIVTTPHRASIRDAEKISVLLKPGQSSALLVNMVDSKAISKKQAPDIDEIIDLVSVRLVGLLPAEPRLPAWQNKGQGPRAYIKTVFSRQLDDTAARLCKENRPLRKFW